MPGQVLNQQINFTMPDFSTIGPEIVVLALAIILLLADLFIPRERKGLSVKQMTPAQRALAFGLLHAGLGGTGFLKATTIMSIEDVLKTIEKDNGERRVRMAHLAFLGTHCVNGVSALHTELLKETVFHDLIAASPPQAHRSLCTNSPPRPARSKRPTWHSPNKRSTSTPMLPSNPTP